MTRKAKKPNFTDEEWAILEKEIQQDQRDEALQMLKRLEAEMYIAGDSRSEIIRVALDTLEMSEVGDITFVPTLESNIYSTRYYAGKE